LDGARKAVPSLITVSGLAPPIAGCAWQLAGIVVELRPQTGGLSDNVPENGI
jgi:hypothetical protein